MKRWKRVLFYKCKLGFALRYSADMFINILKTKLNRFLQNGFKYRKISQLFEEFPRKNETNAFKSFICRRENVTAVGSFASQNCNSWQQYISHKSSFLCSINLTVSEYTKKIFTSVSVASVHYIIRAANLHFSE